MVRSSVLQSTCSGSFANAFLRWSSITIICESMMLNGSCQCDTHLCINIRHVTVTLFWFQIWIIYEKLKFGKARDTDTGKPNHMQYYEQCWMNHWLWIERLSCMNVPIGRPLCVFIVGGDLLLSWSWDNLERCSTIGWLYASLYFLLLCFVQVKVSVVVHCNIHTCCLIMQHITCFIFFQWVYHA